MNSVFAAYMRKFVLVFMDDILIYSQSLEEHVKHIRLCVPSVTGAQAIHQIQELCFCTKSD
jgi:hypothetical protein